MALTPRYIALTSMISAIHASGGLESSHQLVEAALEDLTPAEAETLESGACYNYDSSEGTFDWLIDVAALLGLIKWHDSAGCYQVGAAAKSYF